MTTDSPSNWRTQSFRDNIVSKLTDHIVAGGVPMRTDANQMEANIFQKARSEHEYLAYIARLIVYIRDKSRNEAAANSLKAATTTTAIAEELSSIDEEHSDDQQPTKAKVPIYRPPSPPPLCVSLVALPAPTCATMMPATNGHHNNGITHNINQRRPEPDADQKRAISKTAIATVLQNPGWRCDPATIRPQVQLFGQYVAAQLAQIEDEDVLVSTQQKVMALLNKAV